MPDSMSGLGAATIATVLPIFWIGGILAFARGAHTVGQVVRARLPRNLIYVAPSALNIGLGALEVTIILVANANGVRSGATILWWFFVVALTVLAAGLIPVAGKSDE